MYPLKVSFQITSSNHPQINDFAAGRHPFYVTRVSYKRLAEFSWARAKLARLQKEQVKNVFDKMATWYLFFSTFYSV